MKKLAECSLEVVFVFTNGVVLRTNKNYTADGCLRAAVTDLRRRPRKLPAGQSAYVDLSPTVYTTCERNTRPEHGHDGAGMY